MTGSFNLFRVSAIRIYFVSLKQKRIVKVSQKQQFLFIKFIIKYKEKIILNDWEDKTNDKYLIFT